MASMLLLTIIVASACNQVWAGEICCGGLANCFQDKPPFDHLPLPQCNNGVAFHLYTRSENDIVLVQHDQVPESFQADKPTVFIIHGYYSSVITPWVGQMKDAFLLLDDYNVFMVGWTKGASRPNYQQSASNTRVVGAMAASLVEDMILAGASATDIHCVGHSLGAHTCGYLGAATKIGRISGLDPAGPKFRSADVAARLSKEDANFVDVIHTMGKEGIFIDLGTLLPMGHVDFYPNGGGVQPGCGLFRTASALQEVAQEDIDEEEEGSEEHHRSKRGLKGCSHSRAVFYYIESIENPDICFSAISNCSDKDNIPASCTPCEGNCQRMGFSASKLPGRGLFYTKTGSVAPFCLEAAAPTSFAQTVVFNFSYFVPSILLLQLFSSHY